MYFCKWKTITSENNEENLLTAQHLPHRHGCRLPQRFRRKGKQVSQHHSGWHSPLLLALRARQLPEVGARCVCTARRKRPQHRQESALQPDSRPRRLHRSLSAGRAYILSRLRRHRDGLGRDRRGEQGRGLRQGHHRRA